MCPSWSNGSSIVYLAAKGGRIGKKLSNSCSTEVPVKTGAFANRPFSKSGIKGAALLV
jgi:hypothetical protein